MKKIAMILTMMLVTASLQAQHQHHEPTKPAKQQPQKPKPAKPRAQEIQKARTEPTDTVKQAAEHMHHNPVIPQPQKPLPAKVQDHQMHQGHTEPTDTAEQLAEHIQHDAEGHSAHEMKMSHAFSLNLPMNRNGSGTAWLPDNSAMYGYMAHRGKWMFMFHGNVFIRYNNQDFTNKGSRGGSKVDAPNMLMAMGQRKIGQNGLFHFNSMFSLDALIAGGSGYPLLFQTGETWQDKPLIDRQHPHDLFSELSISYSHAFSKKADAFIYVGYPGEPALGAVTFMHRPSGMFNPDAPISHHWVDATHITFGVATAGFRYDKFKIEASSFTGREPGENRYNFDKPLFDSRSARISYNPSRSWALQVSRGHLKSPESAHPGEDIDRTTASVTHSKRLAKDVFFDATGLWALNKIPTEHASNAALLEATLRLKRTAIYSRYEWVQKSGEELVLDETLYDHHAMYPVNAITLGFAYDLLNISKTRFAIGTQLSMYSADSRLNGLYGKNPLAGQVYLHVYPSLMQ